jgi:hypothetical protein
MHYLRQLSAVLGLSLAGSLVAAPLDFVPAQSPYLLARGISAQSSELDRSVSMLVLPWLVETMRDGYCEVLACISADVAGSAGGIAMPPALSKLFDELAKLARPEQWAMLGLKLDGELVLYGLGALPVLRVELADEAAFVDFVQTLGIANGAPLRTVVLDNGTAWLLGSPPADPATDAAATRRTIPALLLAQQDNAMVATFVAESASDAQIRAQLAAPANALGRAGLKSLTQKYALDGRATAFIDLQKLAQNLLSPTHTADRDFRAAQGIAAPVLEPLCASEALELAARVPKVVFGLAPGHRNQVNARWIVELEPALAGELSRAARRGPQLTDQGHAVDASMALDVGRLLSTLRTRAEHAVAAPFVCAQFAQANQAMQEMLSWSQQTALTPWNGLVSARVEFPGRKEFNFEGMAGSVEARDPLALLQTFNWMFSSLNEVQLSADGKSFVLQEGTDSDRVLASVTGTRINVAVGNAAEQRLASIAAAAEVADAAALSVRIGEGLIGESGWRAEAEHLNMSALAQRVRGMLLETRLTTRGVETQISVELTPQP